MKARGWAAKRSRATRGEDGRGGGLLREIAAVLAKDLLLEWRSRARLLATVLFGIVALALFSFAAGADAEILERGAAGFLVLALLLSSTLALGESFRVEQEDAAIEGLLLLPVDPHALFYGKALGNTLFLSLLGPVLAAPRCCSMLSMPARSRCSSWSGSGSWPPLASPLPAPCTPR